MAVESCYDCLTRGSPLVRQGMGIRKVTILQSLTDSDRVIEIERKGVE